MRKIETVASAPTLHSRKLRPLDIERLAQSLSTKLFQTYWKD
jgi:hypothetical protein